MNSWTRPGVLTPLCCAHRLSEGVRTEAIARHRGRAASRERRGQRQLLGLRSGRNWTSVRSLEEAQVVPGQRSVLPQESTLDLGLRVNLICIVNKALNSTISFSTSQGLIGFSNVCIHFLIGHYYLLIFVIPRFIFNHFIIVFNTEYLIIQC